ncbi:hypothetical protein ACP4OV_025267 [Aristida adscensionis]
MFRSVDSLDKRKGLALPKRKQFSSWQHNELFGARSSRDIWQQIHSLMPLRDAARAACVSRAFLRSWRCHPNLTLKKKEVGFIDFTNKVDKILRKHSGVGVKKLNLEFTDYFTANIRNYYLDSWLQIAVTPSIEELTLKLAYTFSDSITLGGQYQVLDYEFPCSILSDGSRSSIQFLELECCTFRPTVQLGCLGSLTRLHLIFVGITGDESGCLLSNSVALEYLELKCCSEIICLKIPRQLRRLSHLYVNGDLVQRIENKAQNLCSIYLGGLKLPAQLSPGESLQLEESLKLKRMNIQCHNAFHYARTVLPLIAPNLENLTVESRLEEVNIPMAPSKFLHLKYLKIIQFLGFPQASDYFSLVSFINASPSLETFSLIVPQRINEQDSIFGDSSNLRRMPQYSHHNLQSFNITGFSSAKSLIELTCHII